MSDPEPDLDPACMLMKVIVTQLHLYLSSKKSLSSPEGKNYIIIYFFNCSNAAYFSGGLLSSVADLDPHGSTFYLPPGSGSRMQIQIFLLKK
jgi:hypothetical protein